MPRDKAKPHLSVVVHCDQTFFPASIHGSVRAGQQTRRVLRFARTGLETGGAGTRARVSLSIDPSVRPSVTWGGVRVVKRRWRESGLQKSVEGREEKALQQFVRLRLRLRRKTVQAPPVSARQRESGCTRNPRMYGAQHVSTGGEGVGTSGRLHAARRLWHDCRSRLRSSPTHGHSRTKGGRARFNCAGRSVQPMQPVLPVWLLLSTLSIPCSMSVLACWH